MSGKWSILGLKFTFVFENWYFGLNVFFFDLWVLGIGYWVLVVLEDGGFGTLRLEMEFADLEGTK